MKPEDFENDECRVLLGEKYDTTVRKIIEKDKSKNLKKRFGRMSDESQQEFLNKYGDVKYGEYVRLSGYNFLKKELYDLTVEEVLQRDEPFAKSFRRRFEKKSEKDKEKFIKKYGKMKFSEYFRSFPSYLLAFSIILMLPLVLIMNLLNRIQGGKLTREREELEDNDIDEWVTKNLEELDHKED